ncbi:hypothetical protein FRC17_003096 [Serendipita sp. 399]|nr:hypothetical protein FRC17_003096 [Serendipita sp. 399]
MSRNWAQAALFATLCAQGTLGVAIATKQAAITASDPEPTPSPLAKRAYTYYSYTYYTYTRTTSSSTITYRSDPTGRIIAGVVTTLVILVIGGLIAIYKKRQQRAKVAKAVAAAKNAAGTTGAQGVTPMQPITIPAPAPYQYPSFTGKTGSQIAIPAPVPYQYPAPTGPPAFPQPAYNQYAPPPGPPSIVSSVPVDAIGQFANNYRYLITVELEGKLRLAGWLPATDPDSISAEYWQTRYGVDASELAKLKEAYAWQRAMN